MKQYPLRINQEAFEKIEAFAKQDSRSVNSMINKILTEFIKKQKAKK